MSILHPSPNPLPLKTNDAKNKRKKLKYIVMADNKNTSGGIGFLGLLTIAFIVLKLCSVIDWNWWWVLAALWIPFGLLIIGILVYLVILWRKSVDRKKMLASGMNEWAWKRRKSKKPDNIEAPPISKWQQRMEEMKNRSPNR